MYGRYYQRFRNPDESSRGERRRGWRRDSERSFDPSRRQPDWNDPAGRTRPEERHRLGHDRRGQGPRAGEWRAHPGDDWRDEGPRAGEWRSHPGDDGRDEGPRAGEWRSHPGGDWRDEGPRAGEWRSHPGGDWRDEGPRAGEWPREPGLAGREWPPRGRSVGASGRTPVAYDHRSDAGAARRDPHVDYAASRSWGDVGWAGEGAASRYAEASYQLPPASDQRARGPKGWQRPDDRIKEEICEHLYHHHDIDSSDVSVEVSQGVVSLSGTIPERWMKHRIEDMADACPGVKDVENRIRVRRAMDNGEQAGAGTDQA